MEKSCAICPQIFAVLSVPVYLFLYTFTAVIVLLVLIAATLRIRFLVRFLLQFWARFSFAFMLKRLRVYGKENILKGERYVLVANHASLFDILAIMAFYPEVAFFGKAYLTRIPVFGKVLRMINFVPMQTTDLRNTRHMLEQLREKSKRNTVAIFPEGTRTRTGEFNRFRKGFIHLIRATEYKILPVTLTGFYHFKPANRFYINFLTSLSVTIHPVIDSRDILDKEDEEIIEQVREVIQSAYS